MNFIQIPEGMETKYFVMDEHALHDVPELLNLAFPGKTPWIIADENTWNAAGKELSAMLKTKKEAKIFPAVPRLHPDNAICDELAKEMDDTLVPVAVGSGVINDILKRASGVAGIPYCCVPTAASVDGYTSYGAALSVDGFKKTMPCPAPYAIIVDLSVLKRAPAEMFASGYADLLTKVPAGADWFIAESMRYEKRRADVWTLVQKDLRKWVKDQPDLYNVFMGLAATGYSMQMYRDSRPASGAEHLMSHVWEMEGLSYKGEDVSHGFKVAIGTMASVRLMYFIINHSFEELVPFMEEPETREEYEKRVDALLVKGCYGTAKDVAMEKYFTPEEMKERRKKMKEIWGQLQKDMKNQLFTVAEFEELLKKSSVPVLPEEIGLDREQYIHGVLTAQLFRKRYTILDFLYEAGLLNKAVKEVL